ncbi:response regulator [Arsukibacterium ikkense]|uniref:Response regulator n=1 Tax=Arsukibacterium ikkense TaxID=336831 RepID=A0A0M2V7L8_9GAMM|nr:response regulator [Arsukibacterium ikkense]KKO45660.1 response regulator [Arsukibacterium ikkense]
MNTAPRRDERILVIDDQSLAQGFLRFALEQLGYQNIFLAERANVALNLCRDNQFDLIICAHNQQQGKDGFQLYEEIKAKGLQQLSCGIIFISAETDPSLVHSVIELQPDEFLAKPFVIKDLQQRIERVLRRKQQLREVYQALDAKDDQKALAAIDQQLADAQQHKLFPLLLRLKGDVLLHQADYRTAETFFSAMLNIQPFSWARMGLVRCHLAAGKEQQAFSELEVLLGRSESRLFALDLLAELEFKQQHYQQAQQHILEAAELAPRNMFRQQKLLQLSRLNHDYENQYRAARDMVKYARYSMYEQPDLYLTLARASIDYALSVEDEEQSSRLNRQATVSLTTVQRQYTNGANQALASQQQVLQARLLYLQDHKEKAQALLSALEPLQKIESVEGALDRAKALHEVGLSQASAELFAQISRHCQQQLADPLFNAYLQQEQQERLAMRLGPRELNNNAVTLYKHGNWQEAFEAFKLAFTVMPKNAGIALNLWQTLLTSPRPLCAPSTKQSLLQLCQQLIEHSTLKPEQQERYSQLKQKYLSQHA